MQQHPKPASIQALLKPASEGVAQHNRQMHAGSVLRAQGQRGGRHFCAELRNVNWFVKYVLQGDTKNIGCSGKQHSCMKRNAICGDASVTETQLVS